MTNDEFNELKALHEEIERYEQFNSEIDNLRRHEESDFYPIRAFQAIDGNLRYMHSKDLKDAVDNLISKIQIDYRETKTRFESIQLKEEAKNI